MVHQLLKIVAFVVPLHLALSSLYLTWAKNCSLLYWVEKWAVIVPLLGALSWKIGNVFYDFCNNFQRVKGEGKAVFITGCDTGFGFQLAKKLPDLGEILNLKIVKDIVLLIK